VDYSAVGKGLGLDGVGSEAVATMLCCSGGSTVHVLVCTERFGFGLHKLCDYIINDQI